MLTTTQVKILVPGHHDMVRLVGARDELLKVIEAAFDTRILVRGNEIVISGEPAEAERVSVLFEELLDLLEKGQILTTDAVGRSIEMVKRDRGPRPSEVLS
nr:PhoH family protein [Actinomycetota bacterium]